MAGELATSMLSTVLRATNGIQIGAVAAKPQKMLQLYDIENCPYCRLVREALTELDLDVEVYPCPKNGERFRPELVERGGKAQFPYLIDPNTGVEMYESLDIVAYLFETYAGATPLKWKAGRLQTFGSMLASGVRMAERMQAVPSVQPEYMLELYSFEGSPYARVVREMMCNMELPYVLRNCGRTQAGEWLLPPLRARFGSEPKADQENRRWLLEREGRVSIPYLYDPNNEMGMFESSDILDYLDEAYGA